MSHSKGTTNYNLPLFTKDDRPAWLTDFNSAMLGVDAAVKAVADSVEAGGLPVTGGTMQGNIDMGNHSITSVQEVVLLGSPTTDNQAATKKYVDDAVANVPTPTGGITQEQADARYVQLAGGTMTGVLTLSGAPTSDLQASTKKYVDDQIKLNITDVINASY